ncbi:MAG: polysaccharide deacetylase family protein [Novosphingobium sp.]
MAARVDILMYHAIDKAKAPTSISPATFAAQMRALAESRVPVIAMDAVADHLARGNGPAVAITFDDGFQDFADTAWPVLRRHGFPAMVYVPTEHIGGGEHWAGGHDPARRLMNWDTVRGLASEGVDFGNHSASHADLAALDRARVEAELDEATARIAEELGTPPRHAAPPYGRSTRQVRALLASRFATSVGTALGSAKRGDNLHDLPRLEMFYFTSQARWHDQLAGRGGVYLVLRRAARTLRQRFAA